MKDYYYIKCTKFAADDYYLCLGGNFRKEPTALKVFNSIKEAVDWKYNELDQEAFSSIFEGYEMSIVRL